jgi:hypothetical protein
VTVKLEDGAQHKNLRVFSVSTGEELTSFTQKLLEAWDLQFTISESHAIRLVGQEIQVFSPADWSQGVIDKLKVEGAKNVALSPGLNPSIAVFVGEKGVGLDTCKLLLPDRLIAFLYPLRVNQPTSESTAFSIYQAHRLAKKRPSVLSMPASSGIP